MEEHNIKSEIAEKYKDDIVTFGLLEDEAIVYLSLLKRGSRGEVVGRIKNELEIGRTTIYAIMERLSAKGWVNAEEISENPKRIKYIAKSPYSVFNEKIEKKEKELKLLEEYSLYIGDNLEQVYQGAKKLTIDTIHPGGYKYLKPLVEKGWKIKSEVIEYSDPAERLTLDYELKGHKGFPKDCGLIIFNFNRNIEKDENLINEAIRVFKFKTEYEIRNDKIPGFEDVNLKDTRFHDYPGLDVFIKVKYKKKQWLVGKEVVLPIQNKIFLLFGNPENFQFLYDTIVHLEGFHHLV